MDDLGPQLIAGIIGVAFVVLGRLIDRWLPDPEGKHPLPDPPTTSSTERSEPDADTAP